MSRSSSILVWVKVQSLSTTIRQTQQVFAQQDFNDHFLLTWVCLTIVYPYTHWLMIIIPTKWLFHWGYTPFSDIPTCLIHNLLVNVLMPCFFSCSQRCRWQMFSQILPFTPATGTRVTLGRVQEEMIGLWCWRCARSFLLTMILLWGFLCRRCPQRFVSEWYKVAKLDRPSFSFWHIMFLDPRIMVTSFWNWYHGFLSALRWPDKLHLRLI